MPGLFRGPVTKLPCAMSEPVGRNLEIAVAVILGRGQAPTPEVHLKRVQHPVGKGQCRVALVAQLHEVFLRGSAAHMRIVRPLPGDGAFPSGFAAIAGAIVMADEQPRVVRKRQDVLQRIV